MDYIITLKNEVLWCFIYMAYFSEGMRFIFSITQIENIAKILFKSRELDISKRLLLFMYFHSIESTSNSFLKLFDNMVYERFCLQDSYRRNTRCRMYRRFTYLQSEKSYCLPKGLNTEDRSMSKPIQVDVFLYRFKSLK